MNWNECVVAAFWTVLGAVLGATFAAQGDGWLTVDFVAKAAGIAIAPLTLALVLLTRVLADETRKTRRQNSQPQVTVTIEPNRFLRAFDLVVENIGSGPAFEVNVQLEPDIVIRRNGMEKELSELRMLRIPLLKPKQKIATYVGMFDDFVTRESMAICSYRDIHGQPNSDRNAIDMNTYEGMSRLGSDDIHTIARNVADISHHLSAVVRGLSRVNINVFDGSDREREQAMERQYAEEFNRGCVDELKDL